MKKYKSDHLIPLIARAADEGTEVFITDGRFERIAEGVGQVEIEVPPGIYKVRFRSANQQSDKLVEVTPGDAEVFVDGDPVEFRSPIPMPDTSTADTEHAVAASLLASQDDLRGGHPNSQLLVFVRDVELRSDPWVGVSIYDLAGGPVAQLSEGSTDKSNRSGGILVGVAPGTYRIRVDTGSLGTYEMFAVTCAGWQTQVFMQAEDFLAGTERIRRAGLKNAGLLMARIGAGFEPTDRHVRLADLARQGLASGRVVVRPDDLREMLWSKQQDPMLAIYGAHLLLNASRIDHDLIETVIANLGMLIGEHPDVSALALRPGAPTPPRSLEFPSPPMLFSSWALISRGSRRRASLVPPQSPTDLVADELITSEPWLLHRVGSRARPRQEDEAVSIAEATRLVDQLLAKAAGDEARSLAETIQSQPEQFSVLEQSIASTTLGAGLAEDETPPDMLPSAEQAIRNIEAPATSIARSTKSLVEKLEELS